MVEMETRKVLNQKNSGLRAGEMAQYFRGPEFSSMLGSPQLPVAPAPVDSMLSSCPYIHCTELCTPTHRCTHTLK